MYKIGEMQWDAVTGSWYFWTGDTWIETNTHFLLLRDLPEKFNISLIQIVNEDDFFRVIYEDIVIREIEPLITRRMKCYFEDKMYIEFTREELDILLKTMYKPKDLL